MCERETQFFIDLEAKVWAAQAIGDADADRELLSPDFVGLYPFSQDTPMHRMTGGSDAK